MTIALISFILLLGIIFIFLEVFIIPGTTIFGIAGTIISGAAIYFAYTLESTNFGHLLVLLGFLTFIILFFLGRKYMDQGAMTLKSELKGKVNVFEAKVNVGDIGKTYTDIKPNGKALFNDEKIEVFSNGVYIVKDIEIEIIKIENNKIIVKPLK